LGEKVTVSNLAIEKALGELDKFSFIRLTDETVSMHPLLQAVEQDSRDPLGADKRERWLVWAARLFNAFAPEGPGDTRTWDVWLPLLPHAEMLLEHANRQGIDVQPIAFAANQLGLFLYVRAAYVQAEPLMRRALEIDEKSYGPDHPNVAIRLNNLAQLLQATNRLQEAEPLYRRALEIDEKSYGPDHPNVARDLNNLAQLLQATNRLQEAEPLMRRALEIDEKSYGPDHPNVARDLNNLAQLLQATNRLQEAEPLLTRSLAILMKSTRLTGHMHPILQTVLSNYLGLTAGMALSQDEIGERIWALGIEAGFDRNGYRRVLEQVFR
jgi:tetratricopeptide (TPR) repeat protein